ncbi:cysteine-rich receptor-like protein kinase 25 isoform X2 [Diospyros lotus]|uniref:cysteine-rich receptor-like protein kinase 25 isoform X2 n=1 Tax=Diospyros lotus TaxID=55363 RepID=UPI00225130DE|nr:cysteine-rich receptor-like protein kinase 25 isoform X2 [Diospyros lotus]
MFQDSTSAIMAISTLFIFLISSILLIVIPFNTAQMSFGADNFTANNTFSQNCRQILSSLASNVSANGGFYFNTLGKDNATVYALGLCRGDFPTDRCFNCIDTSSRNIIENCASKTEDVDWGDPDRCTVRYSDKSFFRGMSDYPKICVYNTNNISNDVVDEFQRAIDDLVDRLVIKASKGFSKLKFATGKTNFTVYDDNIYGLMQCTPDLSSADCDKCLRGAVQYYRKCSRRATANNILSPSCIFEYDLRPFYESTAYDISLAPPPAVASAPVPPPHQTPPPPGKGEKNSTNTLRIAIIVVVVLTSICLILITLACGFFYMWKKESAVNRRGRRSGSPETMAWLRAATKLFSQSRQGSVNHAGGDDSENVDSLQYDFDSIRVATNDFSNANKLGEGGFGPVYKARLANGQEVAVKRLASHSEQGEAQFKNEIVLMANLQHKNLVRLLGFCLHNKERLLIYELLPNASLDRFIFDPIKRLLLSWETRHKIIVGIARGILYFHQDSQLKIIHHDLKAGNVLLDSEMNAKISDFGMARLFAAEMSKGNTKRIAGTLGYMPPEYAKYGQFSIKTDVFSFGVIILEIITGLKNKDCSNPESAEHLISYDSSCATMAISTLFIFQISSLLRCLTAQTTSQPTAPSPKTAAKYSLLSPPTSPPTGAFTSTPSGRITPPSTLSDSAAETFRLTDASTASTPRAEPSSRIARTRRKMSDGETLIAALSGILTSQFSGECLTSRSVPCIIQTTSPTTSSTSLSGPSMI